MRAGIARLARRVAAHGLGVVGRRPGPAIGAAPLARIAVFRYGAVGDTVATLGLIATLRRLYPAAHLTVVTSPPSDAVLSGHPAIDRLVVGPPIALRADPRTFLDARRRMRALSDPPLDLAVLPHGDVARLLPARFLRARWTIGFAWGEGTLGALLTHAVPVRRRGDPRWRPARRPSLAEQLVDPLRLLRGDDVAAEPPRIHLDAADRAAAARIVAAHRLGRPLVALAPGGTLAIKRWPAERFVALAAALAAAGASVVVLGGPDEARLRALFSAGAPDAALPERLFARGGGALRESLALLAAADLVIGGDTGLIHAAAALGVPTLALFGPTDAAVYGQAGSRDRVLQADLACVPCDATACRWQQEGDPGAPPCLDRIAPDSVLAAALDLLASPGATRASEVGP